MSYKAILFAVDGDFVTDYKADTVEGVWEQIENGGSRWIFYPYSFVIRDNGSLTSKAQRIVDTADYPIVFRWLKNRSIRSASRYIAGLTAEDHYAIGC